MHMGKGLKVNLSPLNPLTLDQVIEIDAEGPPLFEYDEEWLGIMRGTHDLINLER